MDDIAITSAQIIFSDKMTLDEKMSATLEEIEALKTKVAELEAVAE